MKAESIARALRELGVPHDRAREAGERYGDEASMPTINALALKEIQRAARKKGEELERKKFRLWCKANDLPAPAFEVYFAKPERHFRWDIAWEPEKVAVEVQGGVFRKGGGAHQGKGHLRDMTKINLGQSLGWHCLQFTPGELYSERALDTIKHALKERQ